MAQIMWAIIHPQTKKQVDPNDYLMFPDEANDLPDDVTEQERRWMMVLKRAEGA